jgi:prolyl oligopeptidase
MNAFAQEDPYVWLEDVTGDKPMAWVKDQNAVSVKELEARPEFKGLHEKLVAIYNSRERIPVVQKRGKYLYNFWQDAENPRGVWRRTSIEEYRKKDPQWETVLDLGKLSADENEKWVFKGANCLHPDYTRCLITLSRGGADAAEIREFDTVTKQFVKDGFVLKESKGGADWRDRDTLYIERDFGPGTLTTSGYPRQVKEWKRGTPVESAKLVFEGKESDVGVATNVIDEAGRKYEMISRNVTFWESEDFIRVGDKFVMLDTPRDAAVTAANGMLLVRLKSDWKLPKVTYPTGALLAFNLDAFLEGKRGATVLYEPTERAALRSFVVTKDYIYLDILDNVKSRVVELRRKGDRWVSTEIKVPPASVVSVAALDRDVSNDYWMTVTSFVEPTTLYLGHDSEREKMKSLPAFFDAQGLKTVQYETTSRDGTKIPYFVVMRDGTKLDGSNPTILSGYGGFEVSMLPNYSGTIGAGWLERGGVWVLANLRGGGEFGPKWHTVALRENRQMAYDDFIAVAEDLIRRKITSPQHLGIMGGSQGGLLVGSTFVQRPDLFKAVVCQVPLLDMRRYNKLLAGASWQGEYGNPDDPKDWTFISKYSPYQNVKKDAKYPRIFFWTTTRDDRVHPGHARKMVARMKEQGHDVLYFEYTEGGHGAGSTPAQQAYLWALTYTYFWNELK